MWAWFDDSLPGAAQLREEECLITKATIRRTMQLVVLGCALVEKEGDGKEERQLDVLLLIILKMLVLWYWSLGNTKARTGNDWTKHSSHTTIHQFETIFTIWLRR